MRLDYHLINSTSDSISKKLPYKFQSEFRKLFVDKNKKNDLVNILLPELVDLSRQKKPFFLLFHQRWNDIVPDSEFKNYYDPDENFSIEDKSYCRNADIILKEKDMTYDQKFESRCMAKINKQKIATARLLEVGIDDFISKMKQNKELDNVEIIITSDHGYMTEKNKLSYGFHNDELVVKVPLIIFNKKKEIINSNYFTLDLVSYILKNYNINYKSLYKYSVPLESDIKRNFPIFSISRPGKYYKNWLVSYYIDNKKYEINIHKEGKGESKLYEINNFEQKLIKEQLTPKELENFYEILDLLGIEKKSINKQLFNN
jgi:predicted AlkP superfamily pyrophosphatase or phosphodiesterase